MRTGPNISVSKPSRTHRRFSRSNFRLKFPREENWPGSQIACLDVSSAFGIERASRTIYNSHGPFAQSQMPTLPRKPICARICRHLAANGDVPVIMFNANAIRLRACRKRGGLDQVELAHLLGTSCSSVSRFERGLTIPETPTLIAYQLTFDIPASKILPDTTRRLRRQTLARLETLLKRTEASSDRAYTAKVEFLKSVRDRVSGDSP
jgi:transcriptional regulator with XRE-family HTH domain